MADAWPAIRIMQHQRPVAADHGEHPGGDAHHDEAARHVRRPPPHPAPGPVAQPSGHGIGEPADQSVGGQGEGDRQGSRGPLLDEEGDEHAGHGQIGPGADQPDGQADEAPDPGGVDAPGGGPEPGVRRSRRSGRTGRVSEPDAASEASSGPPVTRRCHPGVAALRSRRLHRAPSACAGTASACAGGTVAVDPGGRGHLGTGPLGTVDLHVGQPELAEAVLELAPRPHPADPRARPPGSPGRRWPGGPGRAGVAVGTGTRQPVRTARSSGWPPPPRRANWPARPAWPPSARPAPPRPGLGSRAAGPSRPPAGGIAAAGASRCTGAPAGGGPADRSFAIGCPKRAHDW